MDARMTFLVLNGVVLLCATHLVCSNETIYTVWHRSLSFPREGTPITVIYDDQSTADWLLENVGRDGRYIILYHHDVFIDYLRSHLVHVLELSNSVSEYRNQLNFLLVCRADCIISLMKHASDLDQSLGMRSLLRHFSTWLIITSDPPPHLDTPLDHVTAIVTRSRHHHNITLQNPIVDVYTLLWRSEGRRWLRVNMENVPQDKMHSTLFPNTLTGLNGRQLVLSTMSWPGDVERVVSNGTVTYVGAGIDTMDILKRIYNFTYIVVEPVDKLWGQIFPNGSVTGVLRMVMRGDADVCPSPYGNTLQRSRIFSFSSPLNALEPKGIYAHQTDEDNSWLYLLSCFTWKVYLMISTAVVLFMLMFFVVLNLNMDTALQGQMALSYSIGFTIRASLRQDYIHIPASVSARILLFTWCLFSLVMSAVYTGNLVAMTTVSDHDLPFSTLDDLVAREDYEIGVIEGGYAEGLLMNSTDPVLKSLHKRITKSSSLSDENWVAGQIQRLMKGKYVLFAGDPVRRAISSQTCNLKEIKERLNSLHTGFIYPKHSPLAKLFDEHISHLREQDVYNRLLMKYFPKSKTCGESQELLRLNFDKIQILLATTAGCVVISIVVLILEILNPA